MTIGEPYTSPETMGTPAHERIAPYLGMIRQQTPEVQSSLIEMLTRGQPPAQPAPEVTGQIPEIGLTGLGAEDIPGAAQFGASNIVRPLVASGRGGDAEGAMMQQQAREFYPGFGPGAVSPPVPEMENLPPGRVPRGFDPNMCLWTLDDPLKR